MNRSKLSEFLGIMLGDGNIYSSKINGNHRTVITGHSQEDFDYLVNYVKPMIKDLFGFNVSVWKHKNKNAIALAVYSKSFIKQLLSYGLVAGPKTMKIPPYTLENRNLTAKFLKGIADTDFSVTFKKNKRKTHSYPVITANFAHRNFVYQLKNFLSFFQINSFVYELIKIVNGKKFNSYQIELYGKNNLNLWLKYIGFSNPKHLTKIELWKKFGSCSPNTTIKERLFILNKKPYKDD